MGGVGAAVAVTATSLAACGDDDDQSRAARKTPELASAQSLFFAMTELCKGRPASYEPAKAAVRAVRQGKYRADLGTP